MIKRTLDLDAVQAFIHIANLGSFTRAAEAMRTTQAAVSLKLQRLEERLTAGLPSGRADPQDTSSFPRTAGPSSSMYASCWKRTVARMNAPDPQLLIKFRIEASGDQLQRFDRRELDMVIVYE